MTVLQSGNYLSDRYIFGVLRFIQTEIMGGKTMFYCITI